MTGSTPTNADQLRPSNAPLTIGAASYLAVMRSQLEMSMQMTAAWTAAVAAMSNRMLAPGPGTGSESQPAPPGTQRNGFQGLRSVGDSSSERDQAPKEPATERHSADFIRHSAAFERPATSGMLRWLTQSPTLQNNLFDETIELLVDEDIKTAS